MTTEKSKVSEDTVINAFTHGACNQQAKLGGWGFVLTRDDKKLIRSGGTTKTTNNQMELTAIIEAVRILIDRYPKNPIVVHSNSQYVINGISKWLDGWKRNNWRTATNKLISNMDLWIVLERLTEDLNVEWKWVKSDDNCSHSDQATELAKQAIPAA